MAWENHNGQSVYYRSRREGKHVLRDYYGSGDLARLAAGIDDYNRRRKEQQQQSLQVLRQRWKEANKPTQQLQDCTRLLLRAVRLVQTNPLIVGPNSMTGQSDDILADLKKLLERGEAGDTGALADVQTFLHTQADIANHFGNIAGIARDLWLAFYAGGNVFMAEATRKTMVSWKESLAGPAPSVLELLLIEQILVCWLRSHGTQALLAQAVTEKADTIVVRERQRQQAASQHGLAAGLKQLAELRKLLSAPVARTSTEWPIPTAESMLGQGGQNKR
jgi:hypothetical protein